MMQITPQHNLFLWVAAIDFRAGIDVLVGLCRKKIQQNPFCGTIFAFRNKRGTGVKLLTYDGTGFWLMHKRFSKGVLQYWPQSTDVKICATTMI